MEKNVIILADVTGRRPFLKKATTWQLYFNLAPLNGVRENT